MAISNTFLLLFGRTGVGYRTPGTPPLLPPSAIRTANFLEEPADGRTPHECHGDNKYFPTDFLDGPGGASAPPGRPPLLPPSAIRTANFSLEFFRGAVWGERSRSYHFKKFAKANFLKWCRGGVWRGLPPQESPLPVPCPQGGSGGLRPFRNLRYPCLAPAGRRTDGEKSKNEPQAWYRPKNLTT